MDRFTMLNYFGKYGRILLFAFTVKLFNYGVANQGAKDVICDKVSVSEPYGQIISPNISLGSLVTYPNLVNCAWYLKVPMGMLLTLSFRLLDIEEGHRKCEQKPCCGDSWLSVSSLISGHGVSSSFRSTGIQETVNLRYCGRNLPIPPLVFSGPALIINFRTGFHVSTGRGFIIDYLIDKKIRHKCDHDRFHCSNGKCILTDWICNGWDECGDGSDEHNCTVSCPNGLIPCSNTSGICYDYVKDHCNGIQDCPSGEDENACAVSCENRFSCRTRGGCYNSLQRCDGIRDCIDSSDEEGCDASLCGPHRDGFLCRNRRCISALMRCDGIQDCGDFSDEETCMRMSVTTAVILGSLLCGLLLVLATGCGLRLYHLRITLERRFTAVRQQQQHHFVSDFDEFGRRRPVMGRLPPPTYAQAVGNVAPIVSNFPSSVPVSSIPRHPSHRSRRHARRSRRQAPSLPNLSVPRPADGSGDNGSQEMDSEPPPELPRPASRASFVSRILRSWRKHWGIGDSQTSTVSTSNSTAGSTGSSNADHPNNAFSIPQSPNDILVLEHVPVVSDAVDTEPLIESRP